MPASRAIDATVSGRSPESTFSSTPCAANHSTVAARLRPQALGEDHQPLRTRAALGELGRRLRTRVPAAPPSPRRRPSPSEPVEVEVLGRAEDVADAADPLRAEAQRDENGICSSTGTGADG